MLRAIIIDDDQWAIADMKRSFDFESYGFSLVGTYRNAEDAMEAILQDPPDLIVSDICMEASSGIDLSRTCREHGIDALIVLVSGYDDFEYVNQAFQWNVFQYLLKPLDDEKVAQVMQRAQKQLGALRQEAGESLVDQVVLIIEEQYMQQDLRLESVAERIHVNKNYLSEQFRLKMGISFTDYKNLVRLRKAKEILRKGTQSMTQIALAVGFDSSSYFSRIFKQYTGITPQEYRKNRRNKP